MVLLRNQTGVNLNHYRMAKNPVLPLYYNDIDRSTRTWTDEEFGAYMRLLIEQWDKGSLPNNYQKLTRLATSLDSNWPMLKEKFPLVDGVLKNPVMEEIREKIRKHSEKQKENVRKRYQNSTKPSTTEIPLEVENENEIENDLQDDGPEEGFIYAWETEEFKAHWIAWRTFRKNVGKPFFNMSTEQAGMVELSKIAQDDEEAKQIIRKALSNGWKDLYPLKKANEKSNHNGIKGSELDQFIAETAARVRNTTRV